MRNYLIIVLISFTLLSCEEKYKPDLQDVSNVLVIEGEITNEIKTHTIKLSQAIPYNSSELIPETEANVSVKDNSGKSYHFPEKAPGVYQSDPSIFIPHIGKKYTLFVRTKDNKQYNSTEQELLPLNLSFSLRNTHKIIDRYQYMANKFVITQLEGADLIGDVNFTTTQNRFVRFSNTVMVEYTELPENSGLSYCWKKFNFNETFNINSQDYSTTNLVQHKFGFCPLDTGFYEVILGAIYLVDIFKPIYIYRSLLNYVVSFKQYQLNEDVYSYYKSINKQLEAKQRIFDPINSQVFGNITCVSHPNEKVFGVFEASSVNVTTYIIDFKRNSQSYTTIMIDPLDMDSIPNSGKILGDKPNFWVN